MLLLSSVMLLVSALLVNNVQRQYPKFWVAQIPPPVVVAPPELKDGELGQRKAQMAEDSSAGSVRSALRDLESGPL